MSSTKACKKINVSEVERVASVAGGTMMILSGLRCGTMRGLMAAALGGAFVYRGVTGHCHLYKKMGMDTTASEDGVEQGVKVEKMVLIQRPRAELFQFWRRFENLPMIMTHLISVEKIGAKRSRWTAQGPFEKKFTWEADIINETENEMIAWESVHGSEISTAGSVHFEDAGNNGTLVRVNLQYLPPAGKLGAFVLKMLGEDPACQIDKDLKEFKEIMEESKPIVGQANATPQFAHQS